MALGDNIPNDQLIPKGKKAPEQSSSEVNGQSNNGSLNQANYLQILQAFANAVMIIDDQGIIQLFNKAAEELWGYEEAELVGQNLKMLMPKAHADEAGTYIENHLLNGASSAIGVAQNIVTKKKNGALLLIQITLYESKQSNGSTYYTAFLEDARRVKRPESKSKHEANGQSNSDTTNQTDYAQILRASSSAVMVMDAQGIIQLFNKAAEQLWGYEEAELVGQNFKKLVTNAQAKEDGNYLENHLLKGESGAIGLAQNIVTKKKNGALLLIQITLYESKQSNGSTYYTAFLEDARKVKRPEPIIKEIPVQVEEDQANLKRYLQTFESFTDAVIIIDQRGMIQLFNKAAEQMWGYTQEEVLDQNVKILMPNAYAKQHDGYLKNYDQSGEAKLIGIARELMGKRKNGTLLPIQITLNESKQANGSLFIGLVKDLRKIKNTEKLQKMVEQLTASEEELRQNIEELTTAQDNLRKSETELSGQLNALNRTLATAAFDPQGNILFANTLFLKSVGYSLVSIRGKHHSIFLSEGETNSTAYQAFWENLRQGIPQAGEFKRITKNGEEVWFQATYTPVLDKSGTTYKVIKLATDITEEKKRYFDLNGQINAIQKSSACVEFELDGTILSANDMFLSLLGYTANDVVGKHHRIFLEEEYKDSPEYIEFWKELEAGHFQSGEFKRLTKDGQEVWIFGSYNPIFDQEGRPFKVVKFAQDITAKKQLEAEVAQQMEEVQASEEELRQNMEELSAAQENLHKNEAELSGQINAINRTLATIIFDPEGNILNANDIFLEAMGYNLEEIQGDHHRIFLTTDQVEAASYEKFWNDLRQGLPQSGEFKRIDKQAKDVWLQATYTPVTNSLGEVLKVIKLATIITEQKERDLEAYGKLQAITRSTGLIEFTMDGTILDINENFLNLIGYQKEEVIGKHHRIFLNQEYKHSMEYKTFWEELNAGHFQSGEFNRITKEGSQIWIQGTYNPIFNADGKPYKVVKIAQNVTAQKQLQEKTEHQMEELRATEEELRQNMEELTTTQERQNQLSEELKKSQNKMAAQLHAINGAYGFICFDPDGHILEVNDLFLKTVGFTREEVLGKHHRILVEPEEANSTHYFEFWRNLNMGQTLTGTFRRIGKTGNEIWLDASYAPVKDSDGKVTQIIKLAKDITGFKSTLNAFNDFIKEIQKGNFEGEFSLEAQHLDADLREMVQGNISVRDNLKVIIEEINRIVNLAGKEGILSERLNLSNLEGTWKKLVDNLNDLLGNISEPILEINDIVNNLAQGDITQRFEKSAQGDLADLAQALNDALNNLSNLIQKIDESASYVANSSQELISRTISMRNTTTEASTAIQQMADGAQDQANRTDESSRLVEQTLKSALEVRQKAEIINNSAQNGQQNCKNGLESISVLINNMNEIAESAHTSASAIDVLTRRSEEISRILSVITDIASQTKMLSFNATIEAARAGEAGRGFKVVADEISKLAEDSRKSTVEIEKLIRDIQRDIDSTGKAIGKMQGNVDSGNQATQNAAKVFDNIHESSAETLDLSKEILSSAQFQKESIDSVVKNIEKIVIVSEETASGTQQLASSSLEMDKGMAEIASTSEKLSQVAGELRDQIKQFKLSNQEN